MTERKKSMRITSKGIINNREVAIVWTNGLFSVLTDTEDDVIKDRLARLNRTRCGSTVQSMKSVEPSVFLMALHMLTMEMYDKRISLDVAFDDI